MMSTVYISVLQYIHYYYTDGYCIVYCAFFYFKILSISAVTVPAVVSVSHRPLHTINYQNFETQHGRKKNQMKK